MFIYNILLIEGLFRKLLFQPFNNIRFLIQNLPFNLNKRYFSCIPPIL